MKNLIFISLLLVTICYSQEQYQEQYYYVIDMRKFATPYSINDLFVMGRKNIKEVGGQSVRLTRLTIPNTVYVRISIAPKNNDEKVLFKVLDMDYNFITKISSGNVVTKWTRFGNKQVWESFKFNDLPEDFYEDFSVEVSTP